VGDGTVWYDAPGFQLSNPLGRRAEHVLFPLSLALGLDQGVPGGTLHGLPPCYQFVVVVSGAWRGYSPARVLGYLFGLVRHLVVQSCQPRPLGGHLALPENKRGG